MTEHPGSSRRRLWLRLGVVIGAVGIAAALFVATGHRDGGLLGRSDASVVEGRSQRTGKPYPKVNADAPLRLEHRGGEAELDRCDGAWTLMEEYKTDGLLPLWAQHDYCGGSQILNWKVGQEVSVAGSTSTWRVTDVREVPAGSTLEKTRGMKGDLLLQTCVPAPSDDYHLVAIEEI